MKNITLLIFSTLILGLSLVFLAACAQPATAPIKGALGTSPQNPVPLGTSLKMEIYRGAQELTVLSSEFESATRKLTVSMKITALQTTTYYGWDFKVAGSKGFLYQTGYFHKQLLVGASATEQCTFRIDMDDSPPFLLVWCASVSSGIDNRYFALSK